MAEVPFGSRAHFCPVRAWRRWKEDARLDDDPDGFPYRRLHDRWETLLQGGLDAETVGDILTRIGPRRPRHLAHRPPPPPRTGHRFRPRRQPRPRPTARFTTIRNGPLRPVPAGQAVQKRGRTCSRARSRRPRPPTMPAALSAARQTNAFTRRRYRWPEVGDAEVCGAAAVGSDVSFPSRDGDDDREPPPVKG